MHEKNSGFTLIELLVIITITLILTGFGVAGYNNFNQRQILRQAAENVKSSLRDAQNRALAGEKQCKDAFGNNICQVGSTCGDGNDHPLNYWRFSASSSSYSIFGNCGASNFGQKNYNLPPNLTFSSLSYYIDFIPLSQGIRFTPVTPGLPIPSSVTITINQSTNSISITVSPSGEIRIL